MVRYWANLTSIEVTNYVTTGDIRTALLPVGATENHGEHLPLGTDSKLTKGLLDACFAKVGGGEEGATSKAFDGVVILPATHVGTSEEHGNFAGTLTVTDETLIGLWMDMCRSVRGSGISKVIILNGHGGQIQNVDIVCRRLRFEQNMLALGFHLQAAWGSDFGREDMHAGGQETSVMMHLYPDEVRSIDLNYAHRNKFSEWARRPIGEHLSFGWRSEDFELDGVIGYPGVSDPETGRMLLDKAVGKFIEAVVFADSFNAGFLSRAPDAR